MATNNNRRLYKAFININLHKSIILHIFVLTKQKDYDTDL